MNMKTQIINAYLNGELEECEIVDLQAEAQSNENLELALSYEMLKMMEAERALRAEELNNMKVSQFPKTYKKKGKVYQIGACLHQLFNKRS